MSFRQRAYRPPPSPRIAAPPTGGVCGQDSEAAMAAVRRSLAALQEGAVVRATHPYGCIGTCGASMDKYI